MRWLDALGWFKWPSLLLIASPIAAYPFWSPEPQPAAECGLVAMEGRLFRAFKAADGSGYILRPTGMKGEISAVLDAVEPVGFDSGGMIVDSSNAGLRGLDCSAGATG